MNQFATALIYDKEEGEIPGLLVEEIRSQLEGKSCDLLLICYSEGFQELTPTQLLEAVSQELSPKHVVACNVSGVLGGHEEVEMKSGVSALAMHLPQAKIQPFVIMQPDIEKMKGEEDLLKYLDLYPTEKPNFISFADPKSCDIVRLLNLFNEAYVGAPVVGGLNSGMSVGAEHWLALNGEMYEQGAVGVAITGECQFETIVSQGCRPVGEPRIVTSAVENVLYEVAGKPVVEILQKLFGGLSEADKQLAQQSLFLGIVMDESKQNFKQGDFLIRTILGVHEDRKGLVIGETIQEGQTVQFQLRDAETAKEDMQRVLKEHESDSRQKNRAGFLVSCCGRGQAFFQQPNHDVELIQSLQGPLPLAGFFSNGEFGLVQNKNYVHGYTSSLTLFS